MSSRFFGEYLVERGVISPDALVASLIEQMSSIPLVSEVVYENKLMDANKLMEVFHIQQETGEDFISVCTSMGLWHEELSKKVNELINARRTPVGQILIQKGYLDIKLLTKNLDDYLAQAEIPESSVPVEESPETDEDLYQPGIIAELEDMFDERKRKAVKVALGFIKDKNPPSPAQTTKLMQDSLKIVKTIQGLVKIFGLFSLEKILNEMERVMLSRMDATMYTADEMSKVAHSLTSAMEEAWTLRESISQHCSDKFYMNNPNSKKKFDDTISELKEIS